MGQETETRVPEKAIARMGWIDDFGVVRHGVEPDCRACEDTYKAPTYEAKTADHILTDTVPSKPCPSCRSATTEERTDA